MIRLSVLCVLGACLPAVVGLHASSIESKVRGRNTAEVPGWEDNDYRIEETGNHLWDDIHHYPKHPRPKPLHHPAYEHDPWEDEPYQEYDPWEEPCVPYEKGGWSEYAYDDVKETGNYKYDDPHTRGTTDWAKKALKDEMWWGYHGKEPKGNKGKMMKGMKGLKSKEYKPYKPPKHKPKPCPTKEPSKYGSGSYYSHHSSYDTSTQMSNDDSEQSPTYDGDHPPKTTRDDEIIVPLSSFKIQFKVAGAKPPDSSDVSYIESATMDLLQDYFFDVFAYENSVTLNFVDVAVPEDKAPYVQYNMIAVFFRAKLFFDADSEAIPTTSQLDILLKSAFWGKWLDEYHDELKSFPPESIFHGATVFSVASVSNHGSPAYNNGAHQWTPKDSSNKNDSSSETDTVSSTNGSLPEITSTSSSLTPPVMVITVVSSTMFVMGALFFALHKQKALKERQKKLLQNRFPPPKDDGQSIAEATMVMMEDEDSMVECELGDDNFSVGSKSTRRSRAENFLRLIDDDDRSTGSRPRRFLVANASRKANTWNQ